MTTWIITYCLFYLGLLLVGRIGIYRHFRKEEKSFQDNNTISLEEITLVVPFRNEEKRIKPLLDSILNSEELPAAILFVDDNSTDNTVGLIRSYLKKDLSRILKSEEHGKKAAIRKGINHAGTPFILTMDADVRFLPDYFSGLKQLKQGDLHIFPVTMSASGWKKLFEMDVYMVNSLNLVANGLFRPIAASGANLLFRKEVFEAVDSYPAHKHILSGDDQFLLADFNKKGKEIHLHPDYHLSVNTPAPASLKELISQRSRWILKTPEVRDSFAIKIGSIQMVTTFLFFGLIIGSLVQQNYLLFFILLAVKTISDFLLAKPYFTGIKKQGLLFLIPVYELILPIYTLFLGSIFLFFKPKWKGRNTSY